MLKWSPNEFSNEPASNPLPSTEWKSEKTPNPDVGPEADSREARFQTESRFRDPANLLNNLSTTERFLVFDLAEQDVEKQYKEQEEDLKADLAKQLDQAKSDFDQKLENWTKEFGESVTRKVEEEIRLIGMTSAKLAVELAGKITRSMVQLDQEILVRTISSSLTKISGNSPIKLEVHPEDAAWLENNPDLLKTMNIQEVAGDMRIERGGCLLRSGVGEWDATIEGQLETLEEAVQAAISKGPPEIAKPSTEDNNDSDVE